MLRWSGDRALIHYIGWQTMWNEWFTRDDMLRRTRPLSATPRFGILQSKEERNRIKRCQKLADSIWADDGEGGGAAGTEKEKEGGEKEGEGARPEPEDEAALAAQGESLLALVGSVDRQQARVDKARQIERSAAAAREEASSPTLGAPSPTARRGDEAEPAQDDDPTSESDESISESESESEAEEEPEPNDAVQGRGGASAGVGSAKPSTTEFNGAIAALDSRLVRTQPLFLCKPSPVSEVRRRACMSQEGAGAKGLDQSARTALYNRALCHHYAGRTAEAKARTLPPTVPRPSQTFINLGALGRLTSTMCWRQTRAMRWRCAAAPPPSPPWVRWTPPDLPASPRL